MPVFIGVSDFFIELSIIVHSFPSPRFSFGFEIYSIKPNILRYSDHIIHGNTLEFLSLGIEILGTIGRCWLIKKSTGEPGCPAWISFGLQSFGGLNLFL